MQELQNVCLEVPKSRQLGYIRFDEDLKLYVLVVNDVVVSKSKHPDYWEYHLRRGDLAKALVSLNITEYVHEAGGEQQANADEPSSTLVFTDHHFSNSFLAILGGGLPEVKRKRGRPKKQVGLLGTGVRRNSLSDDEPCHRAFSKQETLKIKVEYKKMIDLGYSMRESLIELTIKYNIPYKRAYEIVMDN